MNCQAKIMDKNSILIRVLLAVESILRAQRNQTLSSNEIFSLLPNALQHQLNLIASNYNAGACRKPASYVGTAAAMLAKANPAFFHDRHYRCPILDRYDDAFRMI